MSTIDDNGTQPRPEQTVVPNRIKELREKRGWSQRELADKAGIHPVTMSRMERGLQQIRTANARKIAAALRVDERELSTLSLVDVRRTLRIIMAFEAGVWKKEVELPESQKFNISIPDDSELENVNLYAGRMSGTSMNEIFPEGTVLIIAPMSELNELPRHGERYHIRRARHDAWECTVKELHIDKDGKRWLRPRSTDPTQQEWIPINDDDRMPNVEIVGRVVGAYVRY